MDSGPDDTSARRRTPDAEDLYDAYLDSVLRGGTEDVDRFLARHGVHDESLAASLRAIHAEAAQGPVVARAGDLLPGTRLDDFTLIRKLGEGGMGVVWLARQESLGREVALKLVRAEYASSPVAARRFEREARTVAKLRHPNIIGVIAVGEAAGKRYLAMEYVEGEGLDEVLERAVADPESLPMARAVRWCADLARALDAAHERGVIHRDVKPSNILITPDRRPLLLDFGLAREIDGRGATMTQSFVGSPFYASPEQIGRGGGALDGRTDVYSLGVVLYQCLTRTVPFASGTLERVLQSILTDDPPPAASLSPDVPRDLSIVVAKAMARDPARRYQTAAALADDLEAVLGRRPIAARPPGRVERAVMWSRRRPATATALGALLATAAIVAGVVLSQRVERAREDRRRLDWAVSEANSLIAEYGRSREESRTLEQQFQYRDRARYTNYWTAEQDRELDELERQTRELRRTREQLFYSVLDLVREAERLGVREGVAEDILGRLYAQRFLEAQLRRNPMEIAAYRELALEHDRDGTLIDSLRDGATLSIATETPGADVFLFRREPAWVLDNDAEPRLVLVPVGGQAPAPLDAWALRVVRGAGGLDEGDLILELGGAPIRDTLFASATVGGVRRLDRLVSVDGRPAQRPWDLWRPEEPDVERVCLFERDGERFEVRARAQGPVTGTVAPAWRLPDLSGARARVWSGGALAETTLPAGLGVRPTAAPAFLGAVSHLGKTPIEGHPVYEGDHVVVLRREGHETRRLCVYFERRRDNAMSGVELLPAGSTPVGFVYIGRGGAARPTVEPFWIMEREVTLGEYLEFLNAPETLARIDSGGGPAPAPRLAQPLVRRGDDGRFSPVEGFSPDWPVMGVNWFDANAYAAWRTERARREGRGEVFTLPTQEEWILASGMATDSEYVFGGAFRPKWVSSVRAKPMIAMDAPISFPIDESPLGVFDLAGCISEWTLSRWGDDGVAYLHAGGSYAHGDRTVFRVYGGNGLQPEQRSGAIGFRLVMRRGGGAP